MEALDITNIPNWCTEIFDEDQKDPDKDPGFMVTTRLWARKGDLLMEGSFMYTGQNHHTMNEFALNGGTVHRCTVHWKGNSIDAEHDMHGCTPHKGDPCTVTLHNLRQIA